MRTLIAAALLLVPTLAHAETVCTYLGHRVVCNVYTPDVPAEGRFGPGMYRVDPAPAPPPGYVKPVVKGFEAIN